MSPAQKFFYTAVLAEIIHSKDDKEQQSQKIQFFTKNSLPTFPLTRMQGLQQSAAQTLRDAGADLGNIQGVWILNMLPLGEMTEAEFEAEGVTLGLPPEQVADAAPTPSKPKLTIVAPPTANEPQIN